MSMMQVAITGASGFIGSHLASRLGEQGHHVVPLPRELLVHGGEEGLREILEGCNVVVNLAGAPINHRWTKEYKREIYASRVETTHRLVAAINALYEPPEVMLSASAVGYYGPGGCHGEADAPADDSFLADVCTAWEREAEQVRHDVRLVRTRFGVVLSPVGGALPQMLRTERFGLTAAVGAPDGPFAWVALEDLVNALIFLMGRRGVSGPVNVTAPERTTNANFYRVVAERFKTGLTLHVPDAVLTLLMGEAAQVVTRSVCAAPETLLHEGFEFQCPDIETFFNKAFPVLSSVSS